MLLFCLIIIHFLIIFLIVKYICQKKNKLFKIKYILLISTFITSTYLLYGYYQATHIVKTTYNLDTYKLVSFDKLRIAYISDLHIGNTINHKKLEKIINEINTLNPDIIIIGGDIADNKSSDEEILNCTNKLSLFKSKYGTYFIYGNHDSSSNLELLNKELKNNNITILNDNITNINDDIVLVGRKDYYVSKDRLSINELTKEVDKNKFVIVLNHEPNDLENELTSHVDLILSGHTHGGQLFPINLLLAIFNIYDKIYGIEKINETTMIVSSGLGNRLVKLKTSAKSEYVIVDINRN